MSKSLPPSPSLEQLKKQAKDLRKAHRSADPEAAERIAVNLPRLAGASAGEIFATEFSLQEAQHIIAREYGCQHWEMLLAVVDADLNLLAGWRDPHLQKLLRVIDQRDFVRAFAGSGSIVRQCFLGNMSQRVRGDLTQQMAAHDVSGDSLEARRLILSRATELVAAGEAEWGSDLDVAGMQAVIDRNDFERLVGLEDRCVQTLLREVDQTALVAALTQASGKVTERFLGNMSARVRGFLESEVELAQVSAREAEEVQRGILLQTAVLSVKGVLQWPDANGPVPPASGEPEFSISEELLQQVGRPLDQLTPDENATLWVGIAEQARREGILSLEPVGNSTADPFIREALLLSVDGTEPALLADILETRLGNAILPQRRTRALMVIEGMMAIQAGDNPGIIRHKRALELVVERANPATIMETLEPMMAAQLVSFEKAHRMVIAGITAVQAGKEPQEIDEIVMDISR